MTELKLNSKTETPIKGSRPDRRIYITAVFASLLLVALFLGINAASKMGSKKQVADSSNQNPPTHEASSQSVSAASTSSPVSTPVQAVTKKKTKKVRPSTVTYIDGTYGVSFRYPRKFTLKAGEKANLDSNGGQLTTLNFVEAGGIPVATVELPVSLYKGTDFVSGIFNVSVNKSLTAEQCGQFGALRSEAEGESAAVIPMSESETSPIVPLKTSVRGMEFSKLEMANDLSNTRYYHRYEGGACYEFALGLQVAPHESVDDMPPVDDRDVFARLEKILASVKIKSEVVPEVSTAATVTGAGEGSNH
jgi:hypothetical protein